MEVDDLRNWRYYPTIEKIRSSSSWQRGWIVESPQGYSDLYNPIVMQKLLWLRDLARSNPDNTKYFMWLDSGGICTPNVRDIEGFKQKATTYMRDDRLLVVVSPYPQSSEIHGCDRNLMYRFTRGISPSQIVKGWIMGGTKTALEKVGKLYERILKASLDDGCLGTEENSFNHGFIQQS